MAAVVKETHIPRSTVHVNCFIPPTLLLSPLATDTIKQVWLSSHVWIFSLYVLLSVCWPAFQPVCLSVPSLYFPVLVPLCLLFESSLPSWTSRLFLCSSLRGHETAVWQNEWPRSSLEKLFAVKSRGEAKAKFKAKGKESQKKDNITVGKDIWCINFDGSYKRW